VEFLDEAGFPTPSIGIVGYCMGGTVAFYADTLGLVGAAATYYGGGVINGRFGLPSLVDLAPHLQAPWRGFYGDLDKGIPVEQVEALRDAAATSGVSTDIIRYVDGDHGFHCDDRTAVFNENAAADAYARTLTFFGETLRDK
jgi:carboxymethylenebutenolidase